MPTPTQSTTATCRVLVHRDIDSTNAEALRLAAAGEPGPVWIAAERQTAGKGRSGRTWESARGNLFASLLLPLACGPARAAELSLVTGVAVAAAVQPLLPAARASSLRLKWPNDLLFGRAKAGGILVESTRMPGGGALVAVIGVGLNLTSHPESPGRPATDLAEQGADVSSEAMLERLCAAVHLWLDIWDSGRGFEAVRRAWLEKAGPVGEALTVHAGRSPVTGAFAGLDEDGALLLSDGEGRVRRISYGDVTIAG